MGDTKRGRERKGRGKAEQRRERDLHQALEADEEPPEPSDGEIRIESDD